MLKPTAYLQTKEPLMLLKFVFKRASKVLEECFDPTLSQQSKNKSNHETLKPIIKESNSTYRAFIPWKQNIMD